MMAEQRAPREDLLRRQHGTERPRDGVPRGVS